MRLGISSDAAPDAGIAELVAACSRRGLSALELSRAAVADVQRIAADIETAHEAMVALTDRAGQTLSESDGVRISGILADTHIYAHSLAHLSRLARAPVIIGGAGTAEERTTFARSINEHGGSALPLMHGPAAEWLSAVAGGSTQFAWQIDGSCTDPAADAAALIRHHATPAYVRLLGGGPETAMQDGRGVGALMRCFALAGYTGPLILTPSSRSYRVAWAAWLGRRGGWGCGSKADDTSRTIIPIHA